MRPRSLWRALLWLGVAGAIAVLGWAGLTPIDRVQASASREEIFEIPKGTWARRMSGEKIGILPDEIRLTLGIRDILLLRNLDDVPQIFGPALMMPGQSFRLPFEQASEYQFACTAHASGQMSVIVEPYPVTPWARIHWRVRELMRELG
ncbi:MAG TPA: hypothetical protein VJT10_01410 [Steroidobacteraceae bacterium]|jgi:hypothetical protein|nr:hypothetical protein [Steroidobacteraceae bacterium]